MRSSLSRAREVFSAVARLGAAQRPLTPEFWDELEEMLIIADFGVPTTSKIVTGLQTVAKQEDWKTSDQVVARFRKDVERFLTLPGAELQSRSGAGRDVDRRRQRQRQDDDDR